MICLFPVEALNRIHARQVFFQIGVEFGNMRPVFSKRIASPDPVYPGNNRKQRENYADHQRQPPIQIEHDSKNTRQREQVAENKNESGSQHFIENLNIVHHSGNHFPDRVLVKIGK